MLSGFNWSENRQAGHPLPEPHPRREIDDVCGSDGGGTTPAKQAESTAKNNLCAATEGKKPTPITYK